VTRNLVPLGLAAALLTSACEAFGTARGFAVAAVMLTGALAWLAHRGHAHAGGGTGSAGSTSSTTEAGTTEAGTTEASTGSGTTASTGVDPDTLDSTASGDTDSTTTTGPCLSIGNYTDTDEPESIPCLCACETDGNRTTADWAPALLLPVIARRRRSRRRSLEHLATAGRLPPDVVARLRERIEHDD